MDMALNMNLCKDCDKRYYNLCDIDEIDKCHDLKLYNRGAEDFAHWLLGCNNCINNTECNNCVILEWKKLPNKIYYNKKDLLEKKNLEDAMIVLETLSSDLRCCSTEHSAIEYAISVLQEKLECEKY